MLSLEKDVSKRILAMLPAILPQATGEPIKQCIMSSGVKRYRAFLAGAVKRGDFEPIITAVLATLKSLIDDVELKLTFKSVKRGGRGAPSPHSISPHYSHHGHHGHHHHHNHSHPNGIGDLPHHLNGKKPNKRVVFECSRKHDLEKVLSSILLICDCILFTITLHLGQQKVLDTSNKQYIDLIDGNHTLQPIVYSLVWSSVKTNVPVPDMDDRLANSILDTIMSIMPPVVVRSFLGADPEMLLDSESRLLDATLSIISFTSSSSPKSYLSYVDGALKTCLKPKNDCQLSWIVDLHHRLEILLVHAPNPDLFGEILIRVIDILATNELPVLVKRYLKILLVGSLTRTVSHSLHSLDLWKPEFIPLVSKLESLLLQPSPDEEQIDSNDLVFMGGWCPIDVLLLSLLAITIPRGEGLDRLKPLWETQRELLDSSSIATRHKTACYFTEMAYAVWSGTLRIDDKLAYETVASWLVDLLPLLQNSMKDEPNERKIAPIRLVKFNLFCSKYAPDLFWDDLLKDIATTDPSRQFQFLQMLQALYDFGTFDEFWRLYDQYEPLFMSVIRNACYRKDEKLISQALDLIVRSRSLLAKIAPGEVMELVRSLITFMTQAEEPVRDRVMESLVYIFDMYNEDSALSSQLTQLLVGLLEVQAQSLLEPRLDWDLGFLRRLLILLKVELEDQSVMRQLRVGLLLAVCSGNQASVKDAIECLRLLQTQPYFYEPNRMLIEELIETEVNRMSSVALVQKRLASFLSSNRFVETPLLDLFTRKLDQFIEHFRNDERCLAPDTNESRTFSHYVRALVASLALSKDARIREKRIEAAASLQSPAVLALTWPTRLPPSTATEFLAVFIKHIPLDHDDDTELGAQKFTAAVNVLVWLLDMAVPPLQWEPYCLIERIVDVAHKHYSSNIDVMKRVFRLVHVIATHGELSPRNKTVGLTKIMEVILENYCTPNTPIDLIESALRTLERVFVDFVLDLNDYRHFENITKHLASLYDVAGPSAINQTLGPLLQANVEMASILVQSPGVIPHMRAALFQAFRVIFVSDIPASNGSVRREVSKAEYERREFIRKLLIRNPRIVEVLCDICPPSESNQLCQAIVQFLPRYEMVRLLASHEIVQARDSCDAFRHNSNATRVVMNDIRDRCTEWLQSIVDGFITSISPDFRTYSCELAAKLSQEFEDRLYQAVQSLPQDVRSLLRFINEESKNKAQGNPLYPIYTIMVLRLICPMLMAPSIGLKEDVPVKDSLPQYMRAIASHLQHKRTDAPYLSEIVKESVVAVDNSEQKEEAEYVSPASSASNRSRSSTSTGEMMSDTESTHSTELTLSSYSPAKGSGGNSEFSDETHACSYLHYLLFKHMTEIKHVLLASQENDLLDECFQLARKIGRPIIYDSSLVGMGGCPCPPHTKEDRCLSIVSEYRGLPCQLTLSRKVALVNIGVTAFLYWFNRSVKEINERYPGSPFVSMVDQTGGCIDSELWEAKTNRVVEMHSDTVSKLSKLVILNYQYLLLTYAAIPPPLMKKTEFITGLDMTPEDVSQLNLPDFTVGAVKDIQGSVKFPNIDVCVNGANELVLFDVYVGQKYVQFMKKSYNGIVTNDVFSFTEMRGDNPFQFFSVRGAKQVDFVITSAPSALKRRLNAGKLRSNTKLGSNMMTIDANASGPQSWRTGAGGLLVLCLADMCSTDPMLREAAYQLYTLLPVRFGVNIGLPSLNPDSLKVIQLSAYTAKLQPDLAGDVIRTFLSQGERMGELVQIVAPWFRNLPAESASYLIKELIAVTDDKIIQHIWPLIEGHDNEVLRELRKAAVEDALLGRHMDKYEAIMASRDFKPYTVLPKRLRQILKSDMLYSNTKWSQYPNWAEVDVLISLMAASPPPDLTVAGSNGPEINVTALAEICFIILVFAGIGPYRFRLAIQQILSSVVASLVNVDLEIHQSGNDTIQRRLRSLWTSIQSPHGQVLLAVQPESSDWTLDSWTDFRPDMAEHLSKLIGELCMICGGNKVANFRRLRMDILELLLEHISVVFPALQYRCILGMHGIIRFQMPNSTPERLLVELHRLLCQCEDAESLEVYMSVFLGTFGDLVGSLEDNSPVPIRLAWLALAVLSTGQLSLQGPAQELLMKCIKNLNYSGRFAKKRLDEVLLDDFSEEVVGWWNSIASQHMICLPLNHENFYSALAELLIPGLQHTRTQAVTLDLCELLSSICEGKRAFPFLLFSYMVTSDAIKLQKLESVAFGDDTDSRSLAGIQGLQIGSSQKLLEKLACRIAEWTEDNDPCMLIGLVQGCKLSGYTASMNFMTAGHRLLNVVCSIPNRKVVTMISPLLRPLLSRLLQLEQMDLDYQVMDWSLKIFSKDGEERERMAANLEFLTKLLSDMSLPAAVDDKYSLVQNVTRDHFNQEIASSVAGLVAAIVSER